MSIHVSDLKHLHLLPLCTCEYAGMFSTACAGLQSTAVEGKPNHSSISFFLLCFIQDPHLVLYPSIILVLLSSHCSHYSLTARTKLVGNRKERERGSALTCDPANPLLFKSRVQFFRHTKQTPQASQRTFIIDVT